MSKVVVIGGGGHAKVVIDIIKNNGFSSSEIEVLDDNLPFGSEILSCRVVGKVKDCKNYNSNTKFVIAIGNNDIRKNISNKYDLNYHSFIHPKAIIGEDVFIDKGSVVMAGAIINSGSKIGKHSIINTAVSVDHDSVLGNYVHLSPGVHMGGSVLIGDKTWIGVGAMVKNNINICKDVLIGVGSVVIKDIDTKGTYVGNPLRKIK